ncbi:ATP-binding protein [Pseudomonas sp. NPDC098740]|uniref:ATP-binding protein n=1 Tax=Pseudomonas sp. NPDC098740 TaxID=3364486 RepID=UPI00383B669F
MRRRQNIIITGATGTGKTWLACAFGNQACRLGSHTVYRTATKLFEEISLSYADHTFNLRASRCERSKVVSGVPPDIGVG